MDQSVCGSHKANCYRNVILDSGHGFSVVLPLCRDVFDPRCRQVVLKLSSVSVILVVVTAPLRSLAELTRFRSFRASERVNLKSVGTIAKHVVAEHNH